MGRTVYLGTSEFAATVLDRLSASPHRPALVVSRPDAPRGRGRKLSPPPVVERARELGIEVFQPDSVNGDETLERIRACGATDAVVCAFGALIKDPLLSAFQIFNVHPSLLPRWRGAAPVERAIMAGDTETGVSIMELTAGLDTGPVCLTERVSVGAEDDYGTLATRLMRISGDLLVRALDERPEFVAQPEAGITYAEKITAEDRRLDPAERTASELALAVRALSPHIGAFLELPGGEPLGVWAARPVDAAGPSEPPGGTEPPGTIDFGADVARVACREGVLVLDRVQPPGKTPMAAADWLRGLRPQ